MSKNKIKLSINASLLDENPTGIGYYIINVINFMAAAGDDEIDITVYTASANDSLTTRNACIRKINLIQPWKSKKISSIIRVLWNLSIYPFYGARYDVCLNLTPHGSLFINNQITVVHDLITLRYPRLVKFQKQYYRHLLPGILRKSKVIIAISEYTKRELIHFYKIDPAKIIVIYNGYDQSVFFPMTDSSPFLRKYNLQNYILAVGPTLPHKNFERLIKAYLLVKKENSNIDPLVIVGGHTEYLNKLKALVEDEKATEAVRFTGYVDHKDLPYFYSFAKVAIYPSLLEGFGLPVLEAMACGSPVICSNTSSLPEVAGNAALYFDPTDVFDMAKQLKQFYEDPTLIPTMKRKNLLQIQKFSWQHTAAKIREAIKICISVTL